VHIAVTSDGQKKKIYINGQQDDVTEDAPKKIHASAANLNIGAWDPDGKRSIISTDSSTKPKSTPWR